MTILLLISIKLHATVIPSIITNNEFFINDKIVKFDKFIIISISSYGVGTLFFINKDEVLLKTKISGGTKDKPTPYGFFPIISKTKFHMSNLYPDPSGINNMDDMIRLTNGGIAIHKGSVDFFSHGCIHVDRLTSKILFNLSTKKLPVIITNEDYEEFL